MNASGKDQISCGSISRPCSSLSFAINNVSCHNNTICLVASPAKKIRYTVENTIVIKHSLAVTKFPGYSQNPLITYDLNVTSNRKEFYAFAIFRNALAPNILNLNIQSVDFSVNILTTFSEGFKTLQENVFVREISGFQLRLSISDSIVSSISHAVKFSDISEYENLTIHMKDLVIKSGDFMFENKRDKCKPLEHIKYIIEMYNITICNTGNVTLSVHGCFNMSVEKLRCSNITWKKQELFTFKGGILNTKNVLIKNIFANDNTKYNKSEAKALFLINESVAEIQNTLVKDSVVMSITRPKRLSAVITVQNSVVQILNMKMVGNSFRNFAQANKSFLCFKNMTLIENNVTATLYRVEESNVTLYEIKFHRNNIGCLASINLNSKVLITKSSLTGNEIFKYAYSISRSLMKLNNTNFRGNKIKRLMLAESQSQIHINNVKFTSNHVSFDFFNISRESKLEMYNTEFLQNNSPMLLYSSQSDSIIQNSTLTENNFSRRVYGIGKSNNIQVNQEVLYRDKLRLALVLIRWNSSIIFQNNTLLENNFSKGVYAIEKSSTIQLNHVAFMRNKLSWVCFIWSNSGAIIQNNTLLENRFSGSVRVYDTRKSSTIQLINVAFIRNTGIYRMFFAHSSYLKIDTIFIKNNTFSLLLRVVKCNVSFESMKIRENNITRGMIRVENSAGRMANTYIENSRNNVLASAFTIKCTNLENGYYPFEITSTEIVWQNERPVSARPIIQVCGNVSVSNVKLLVNSLFETEVLQYSTKTVMLPVKEHLNIFRYTFIISSLFIGCTKAIVKHFRRAGSLRCIPCPRGTYTLNDGSLNASLRFLSQKITKYEYANFACLDCPVGANCTASIKSKSNFYGYKTTEQKLNFLPCPKGFCYTANQCNTINSCNKNRVGTLCGRCIKDHVESFLSTDCMSIHSCQNFTTFWLVYCIYAFILTTFLYYMKDFITLIKTTLRNSSKILKSCKKEKESYSEIDITIDVVGAEEHQEKTSHFTVSGIFTLIVSFYQIKQLMKVDVQYKNSTDSSFIKFITDCLNIEMVAVTYSSYCPMSNLDAVSKIFIKTYLLIATLLIACLINYFTSAIFHFFRSSLGRLSSLKPSDRFGVCFIRLLMLSYKNMASASLLLLNCVEVEENQVLFIKGDMECYQWWQIVIAVFFFTWILLFPLSLKVSFNMFMKDKISFAKFILCLIVPFAVVTNYRLNRSVVSFDLQKSRNTYKVKQILSEIFQEPYRLKTNDPSGETVFYETWRLYQRVMLAIVATFLTDPLKRITIMAPIVFLIAISYHAIKPYKPEMYILHWIEIFSILGIFVSLAQNMFRGFLYVYDIGDEDPVKFVWQGFAIFDVVFSPICLLIYFFIIVPIYNKVKRKIISFCVTIRRE